MDYRINKGAGRPIEFKGLKSQYLFFFAGGLVSVFLAVVVLYMAGVSQLVCLSMFWVTTASSFPACSSSASFLCAALGFAVRQIILFR